MKISVRLKPGKGKVAYFVDLTLDDHVQVCGCPVFNGRPGQYRVIMPSVISKEKRYDVVRLSPSIESEIEAAVIATILSLK